MINGTAYWLALSINRLFVGNDVVAKNDRD